MLQQSTTDFRSNVCGVYLNKHCKVHLMFTRSNNAIKTVNPKKKEKKSTVLHIYCHTQGFEKENSRTMAARRGEIWRWQNLQKVKYQHTVETCNVWSVYILTKAQLITKQHNVNIWNNMTVLTNSRDGESTFYRHNVINTWLSSSFGSLLQQLLFLLKNYLIH